MALWRLTDSIWWGNVDSPRECLHEAKAVICLAENGELVAPHISPYAVQIPAGCTRPHFWLPRNDFNAVDDQYMRTLVGALATVDSAGLYPLLIHCLAGVHRSPSVAIYAAVRLGGDYESLHARAKELRPEMEYHDFSKSMHARMKP
jgi:protein-tyrosine phosphatase